MVGARAGVAVLDPVVGDNVVVSRQPPNQPYRRQDVVGKSDVETEPEEVVELELVVVVSSRQPGLVSELSTGIVEHGLHTPPARCLASRCPSRGCC